MTMTEKQLRAGIRDYGTPLYIFHKEEFLTQFKYFRQCLGSDVGLTFCMKTNPFLTAISLKEAERIEVCSDGEFRICRDLQIPPERLLISGVLKREEDLREIIEYGEDNALYTAESEVQLRLLNRLGEEKGRTLPVLLRLTSGNQFGMDSDTILRLVQVKESFSHLTFSGIHFFSGTQKHRLQKHRKELEQLDAFFEQLRVEADFHVPMLEYGTGFGVPYFEEQEEDVTAPEALLEFREMLDSMKWNGKVILEMGRAFAYSCGTYLSKVCDLKRNGSKNYAIMDGGIHQLHYDGQIRGMYRPEMIHLPRVSGEERATGDNHYVICGSLCTVNDVLVADYNGSEIQVGDYLAFNRAGAYSVYEGMSLFLSHELPGVVLYSDEEGFTLLRRQMPTHPLNTPMQGGRE